ncbi:MAG: carboxypeptidase-like regulatory domain-containing protein, partial [Bacteroidales bacterium]
LLAKDSSFIAGSASDKDGKYNLTIQKIGKYILQTSFLGYETQTRNFDISKTAPHAQLNIHLKEQTVDLDEAVIQGKVPDIVLKQDTMEFNADSYKVKEGSPIEDLIRKLPGVQISSDGKITVEGKEINEILVDGRKFFGNDQSITLKNLPADMVNKVQIIDKKSKEEEVTGFSTEEKEKVLNLTIKPDKKKGLFGFGTAGYGTKNRYMLRAMANSFLGEDKLSLIVNTRNLQGDANVGAGSYLMGDPTQEEIAANVNKEFKKGVNLDGSIGFKHNTDKDISSRSSQNLLPDSVYYTNSNSDNRNWGRSMHSNFRFEYKQDTTMNFLIQPNFSYSNKR